MQKQKQVHVIFRGRVQGVGFRFSARSLAEDLSVKGWVANMPNGTVEVVAQQDESVLNDFIGRLEKEFAGYIADRDIQWLPATGPLQGFGIR